MILKSLFISSMAALCLNCSDLGISTSNSNQGSTPPATSQDKIIDFSSASVKLLGNINSQIRSVDVNNNLFVAAYEAGSVTIEALSLDGSQNFKYKLDSRFNCISYEDHGRNCMVSTYGKDKFVFQTAHAEFEKTVSTVFDLSNGQELAKLNIGQDGLLIQKFFSRGDLTYAVRMGTDFLTSGIFTYDANETSYDSIATLSAAEDSYSYRFMDDGIAAVYFHHWKGYDLGIVYSKYDPLTGTIDRYRSGWIEELDSYDNEIYTTDKEMCFKSYDSDTSSWGISCATLPNFDIRPASDFPLENYLFFEAGYLWTYDNGSELVQYKQLADLSWQKVKSYDLSKELGSLGWEVKFDTVTEKFVFYNTGVFTTEVYSVPLK